MESIQRSQKKGGVSYKRGFGTGENICRKIQVQLLADCRGNM
jgi:hypothetical protein